MAEHYCRFNMGYRVNQGHFGRVSLNGLKFWIAGDLGSRLSKGAEWAEITFEPSVTRSSARAITTIVPHVYPVTWKSFTIGADAAHRLDRVNKSCRGAPRRRKPATWCCVQSRDDRGPGRSSPT